MNARDLVAVANLHLSSVQMLHAYRYLNSIRFMSTQSNSCPLNTQQKPFLFHSLRKLVLLWTLLDNNPFETGSWISQATRKRGCRSTTCCTVSLVLTKPIAVFVEREENEHLVAVAISQVKQTKNKEITEKQSSETLQKQKIPKWTKH